MGKGAGAIGARGGGYRTPTRTGELRINRSGMRAESMAYVRSHGGLAPIVIAVHKGERPTLEDGRHRLAAAIERGDRTIAATVRYIGTRGGLVGTRSVRLRIDG